jgi:hypothetical protein
LAKRWRRLSAEERVELEGRREQLVSRSDKALRLQERDRALERERARGERPRLEGRWRDWR